MEEKAQDDEGWMVVIPRWRMKADKRRSGETMKDERPYKKFVKGSKNKWVPKADMVHGWRRIKNSIGQVQEVSSLSEESSGVSILVDNLFRIKNAN